MNYKIKSLYVEIISDDLVQFFILQMSNLKPKLNGHLGTHSLFRAVTGPSAPDGISCYHHTRILQGKFSYKQNVELFVSLAMHETLLHLIRLLNLCPVSIDEHLLRFFSG